MDALTAINQITTGMSVKNLQALANKVDASAGDSTLLLFSGGAGEITNPDTGKRYFAAKDFAKSLSNGTTVHTIGTVGGLGLDIQATNLDPTLRMLLKGGSHK